MQPAAIAIMAWVIFLAVALPGAMVWQAQLSPRAKIRQRLKGMTANLAARRSDGGEDAGARRRLIQTKLQELERQRRQTRTDTLRHLLLQSGLDLGVRTYVVGSTAFGLVVFGLLQLWHLSLPVALLGAAGAGLWLPRMILRKVIDNRQKRFVQHFADALDVLVRGSRSGLPVGECMRIIAREAPEPVGPEFDFLTESQRVGMTLKQALARSVERMPIAELQFFAVVLTVQQQTGGNLAATLENLANVLRSRKRLRDKIVAMSSEARASASIIGCLPFLVAGLMALASPDYLSLLFTERAGNLMLMGGLLWMGLGVMTMINMINFEL